MPKKIKRSTENNLSRNGCTIPCTVTSNDTFQMFRIPIRYLKIYCRSSRPEVFCKKGSLKNFAKFTGKMDTRKIDFKINLTMNLKTDSSTVVFSCESC